MNSRRRIHSLLPNWRLSRWRFLKAHGHAAILSACLLFILAPQPCGSRLPPISLSRDLLLRLLRHNPYDYNCTDLQQELLALAQEQRDEIFPRVLAERPYEANLVFHIFLEKSLLFYFLAKEDSAALYARSATAIAERFAQARNDSFFIHRKSFIQKEVLPHPRRLEQWLLANAVFIRALDLGTKDYELKLRCLAYARAQFQALGDGKKAVDAFWLTHFFRDRQSEPFAKLQSRLAQWLALSKRSGYRDGELEAYLAYAEKYSAQGKRDSALANFAHAKELAQRLGKTVSVAHMFEAAAKEALQRGALEHAFDLTQRGLALSREHGFRYVEADLLEGLALYYHLKQEYRGALENLEAAMSLHRVLNETMDLPPLFITQAKIFLELGDLAAAFAAADSARNHCLALNDHDGLAKTYDVLGLLQAREKNWAEAIAYGELGLAQLAHSDTALGAIDLWAHLGELRLQTGDAAHAKAAFASALQMSLKLRVPLGQAQAYLGLGKIARGQTQTDSALVYLKKAHGLAEAMNLRAVLWQCHDELAQLWQAQGRYDRALEHYERAVAELESIRNSIARLEFRLGYFAAVQEVFDRAIAFAVNDLKDETLALRFSEQSRGRNVLARLQIAARQAPLDFARKDFRLAAADDSTGLLAFRLTDEACYVFFITRGAVKTLRLPLPRAKIEDAVIHLRRVLGVDDREAFERRLTRERAALIEDTERACAQAYQQLLAPLAEELRTVRTLYLAPDGPLHYLPFAALKREAHGPFLGEQFDLAYAPSLSVLNLLLERTPRFEAARLREALVLAMKSASIRKAVDEAFAIAQMLKRAEAKVYGRLTRAELRAMLESPHELIHLALHADLNDKLPFYSYLLLDEGGEKIQSTRFELFAMRRRTIVAAEKFEQESILLVNDLLDLNLPRCELLVLSACKTALGENINGEGVMGLTQGFLCAGTKRLVTSLWEVDDERTFELMRHFYRALLLENQPPGRALRLAEKRMRADLKARYDYPFPHFWASFVLTGAAN